MGKKNVLIIDKDSALAAVEGNPDSKIEIKDPKSIEELRKLIEERRRIGIELSRRLKNHGLIMAADDEDTVPL